MTILKSLLLIGVMLAPVIMRAEDPFVGRWELDTKKSKYAPGTCPKRMAIEMAAEGDKVHYHSETQLESGTSFSADYVAAYNQVPTMVTGAKGVLLPVSLHREGKNTVVASYTSGFETRAVSRRTVSPDGKVMTVTTSSRDGQGNTQKNVGYYRKVPPSGKQTFDLAKTNVELRPARNRE